MKESSKPGQLYYSAIFVFGVLTAFNMFLSIREPGWLALFFFGLATGRYRSHCRHGGVGALRSRR